jgi:predicted Fe-Mo cluster-binding NifX family protein
MKTAFAYWENRVAPVFDTACLMHVIVVEQGVIVSETRETLPKEIPFRKVLRLQELGVETLVCGAVSRPMHRLMRACGIEVIPFVAGNLTDVIDGWVRGELGDERFCMPGCCGDRGTCRKAEKKQPRRSKT